MTVQGKDNEADNTAHEEVTETIKNSPEGEDNAKKGQEDEKIKRYKEQIEGSKKEALANKRDADIARAFRAAQNDKESFVKTYTEDPEIASEVAKMFGITVEEALEQAGHDTPESKQVLKLQKEIADLNKRFEESKKSAINTIAEKLISEIPENKRKEVRQEMDELMEGKEQNETNLEKAFSKAKKLVLGSVTKEVQKTKGLKLEKKEEEGTKQVPEAFKNPRYRHLFRNTNN